ncbi:hypothetical protein BH10ACT1_BH10ACT1_28340 [soil metagenome]
MSREEVRAAQRERLLAAVAGAVAEQGYVNTSVAHIIARAGVSRETFYQQFSSKLDAFTQAFEAATVLLFGTPDGQTTPPIGTPLEQFDAAVTAYLDTLAEHPTYARMFLVEVYAAGPAALARRGELQSDIVDGLATMLDVSGDRGRFGCEVLVAAIGSLVTGPLVTGDLVALRALREPVVDLVRRALAADIDGP